MKTIEKTDSVGSSGSDDEMITRGELCKAAGMSKSTLRRWEKSGRVRPDVDERGLRLFRVKDVRNLIGRRPIVHLPKARALVPSAAGASGELAATIFERLDRGEHAVDIVKELRVHPDVIAGFMGRWARLRGGVFLSKDDCGELARAAGDVAPRTARDIIDGAKRARVRGRCTSCEIARPNYCTNCVREHYRMLKARYGVSAGHDDATSEPAAGSSAHLDRAREEDVHPIPRRATDATKGNG